MYLDLISTVMYTLQFQFPKQPDKIVSSLSGNLNMYFPIITVKYYNKPLNKAIYG